MTRRCAGGAVRRIDLRYQAWVPPQCGQPTEVETDASNTKPQLHE